MELIWALPITYEPGDRSEQVEHLLQVVSHNGGEAFYEGGGWWIVAVAARIEGSLDENGGCDFRLLDGTIVSYRHRAGGFILSLVARGGVNG